MQEHHETKGGLTNRLFVVYQQRQGPQMRLSDLTQIFVGGDAGEKQPPVKAAVRWAESVENWAERVSQCATQVFDFRKCKLTVGKRPASIKVQQAASESSH